MQEGKKYWFAAKKNGLGWVPIVWQGWLVLAVFILFLSLGILLVKHYLGTAPVLAYVLLLVACLVGICWFKGEPLGSKFRNK